MPPEHCQDHGQIMQILGRLEERQKTMQESQTVLFDKIGKLVDKEAQMDIDAAVDRTKAKPIYWGLSLIGGGIFLLIIQIAAKKMGWM